MDLLLIIGLLITIGGLAYFVGSDTICKDFAGNCFEPYDKEHDKYSKNWR